MTYKFKTSIPEILSVIILIAYYKFFYLLRLPESYGARTNIIIPTLVAIAGYFVCISLYRNDVKKYQFRGYIVAFYAFLLVEVMYTIIRYPDEPIGYTLKEVFPFLLLLSYYVFTKFSYINYERLISMLINSATFCAFLLLAQALFFNYMNLSFLQIVGFSYGNVRIVSRSFGVRLLGVDFIDFSPALSIGFLLNHVEKRRQFIMNIVIVSLYELYCSQTRSILLMILFVALIILLMAKYRVKYFKTMLWMVGGVFGVIALQSLWETISEAIINKTDWSFYHRADEYIFYFKSFLRNPFGGIGLLRDEPASSMNYYILHGDSRLGRNGFSDVGLVGVLGRFGLGGLIFYVYLITNLLKRVRMNRDNMVLVAILISATFSTINLSLFDAERIFVFVIFLVIADSECMKQVG